MQMDKEEWCSTFVYCGNRCSEVAGREDFKSDARADDEQKEPAVEPGSPGMSRTPARDSKEDAQKFLANSPGGNKAMGGRGNGCIDEDSACFNYSQFCRVVSDMELDVFFAQNRMPSLGPYPDVHSIKNQFIAMNEKLYKKAKECSEARKQPGTGNTQSSKLKKTYMDVFDPKKRLSERQRRKIDRSVKMYCRSQALTNLFRSYFALVDYHHYVFGTYPVLKKTYYRAIFTIFASMRKKKIMEMFSEISSSTKMFLFLKDLYTVWERDSDVIENKEILARIHPGDRL